MAFRTTQKNRLHKSVLFTAKTELVDKQWTAFIRY